MIHSLLLVVLALSPPAGEAAPPMADATKTPPPLRTGAELRKVIRDSMKEWARVDDDQADEAARQMLALYTELRADAKMARYEREIYRVKLRGRLLSLGKQISKRVAREERLGKREPASLADQAPSGAPGGGPGMLGNEGQQLVEIIQTTIAPQSWDVNGGPGAIYYWRPGHALIIRQTEQGHDEARDLLQQLRRAGG